MTVCYNKKKVRNINFLVTGFKDLEKIYKGLENKDELIFRDKILSKNLDMLIAKTNTICKIQTANIFKKNENGDSNAITTEPTLIIYVDLAKTGNIMRDEMYKYMLTKICKVLKEREQNEKR